MASDGASELEILITAVDEASEAFDEISESMDGMAEAASGAAEETDASLESVGLTMNEVTGEIEEALLTQQQSFALAAQVVEESDQEIIDVMLELGVTAQEAAATIAEANAEIAASSEESAETVSTSSAMSKSSFIGLGAIAGLAFTGLVSAIGGAISSAEAWDQTSAVITQELKDIGSSIPLSAMQAYAEQVQSTTLFTQQQALSAEALIAGQKDLAPQYQNLTILAADLATKMQQFSGSSTADLPSAMKILSNSLNDPVAGLSQLQRQAGVAIPAAMVTMIKNLANAGATALADKELIAAVTGQVGGLAKAAANAPGGGLIQLENALTALGTYIGNDILPALDAMAKAIEPIVTDVAQWAAAHPQLTDAIIAGTVAFAGLILVVTVVGVAIIALGSTFALAAVGIAALVGVIVGVVVANWNIIKTITEQLISAIMAVWEPFWTALKVVAQAAMELISDVLQFEFGHDVQIVTTGFNAIKAVWQDSLSFIETAWKTVWTDMSGFLGNIWTTIQNTVKTGVDYVITAINAFINALDAIHISIPSISIPGTKLATPSINLGFSIPDVPMLADGGFVNSPTLAIIGEAGPEAVIPLSAMGNGGGGFGGSPINIYIQGGNYLDQQGATMIGNALAKQIVAQIRVRNYQP